MEEARQLLALGAAHIGLALFQSVLKVGHFGFRIAQFAHGVAHGIETIAFGLRSAFIEQCD
jgi:hypothetical protein